MFDYIIVNDTVEEAYAKLKEAIESVRWIFFLSQTHILSFVMQSIGIPPK